MVMVAFTLPVQRGMFSVGQHVHARADASHGDRLPEHGNQHDEEHRETAHECQSLLKPLRREASDVKPARALGFRGSAATHRQNSFQPLPPVHFARRSLPRSRNALVITETELKLIASAANIGESSQPVKAYSTPAARGTPMAL